MCCKNIRDNFSFFLSFLFFYFNITLSFIFFYIAIQFLCQSFNFVFSFHSFFSYSCSFFSLLYSNNKTSYQSALLRFMVFPVCCFIVLSVRSGGATAEMENDSARRAGRVTREVQYSKMCASMPNSSLPMR